MTLPVEAQPLDETGVVAEGTTEVRPCGVCRLRLVVPSAALGRLAACPRCGAVGRALPSGGPFADLTLTATPLPQPNPHRPAADDLPPLAPVMPYRRIDPLDDRSPMVDAVAGLQWVSAACLAVVTVFKVGLYLRLQFTTEAEDSNVVLAVLWQLLVAGVLGLVGLGLRGRRRGAWAAALVVSAWVVWSIIRLLVARSNRQAGHAGWFDFSILVELPSLLIAIITLVVLLTPRYRSEFRRPPAQAGTM